MGCLAGESITELMLPLLRKLMSLIGYLIVIRFGSIVIAQTARRHSSMHE